MMSTQPAANKSRRRLQTITRAREAARGLIVFNGGDEPAVLVHRAMRYTFPPCGYWMGANDEEPTEYDGTLEVRDVYGVSTETMRQARKDGKNLKSLPKESLIARAVDIAQHAENKLRARGIVVLTGIPEQDEAIKKEAKNAYVSWRVARARKADDNYRKRSAAFFADPRNAGQVPPSKSPFEISEQVWLDEYMDGQVAGRKYVCKFRCGFEHDDAAVMSRHTRVSHRDARVGASTAEAPEVPEASDVEAVPVAKSRGGRPRKQIETATA